MNKQTLAVLLNLVLSLVIFTMIWVLLKYVIKVESNVFLILSAIIVTKIVCPTITVFQTQSGEQLQLKSIFSKKVYIINN